MKVLDIHHVVIAVKDIEKAVQFFSELFETTFEEIEPPEGAEVRTKISNDGIELISPLTPKSAVAKYLDQKGEGLYGISFRVGNIQEVAENVKEKGIRVIRKVETDKIGEQKGLTVKSKTLFLHPKDAYGVQLILTERETVK
jgi:methylmalonyl-CoA/ethylmalonyl-CoA epimerase